MPSASGCCQKIGTGVRDWGPWLAERECLGSLARPLEMNGAREGPIRQAKARDVSISRPICHDTHRLVTSASGTHRQLVVYMLGRAAKDKVCFGLR